MPVPSTFRSPLRGRALALAALLALACCGPTAAAPQAPYAGSDSCRACHEAEWTAWRGSHHYQAMLPADAQSVLGDFDDARFDYAGVTSRFFRRDGKYFVETDGPDGTLQEYEIAYTFGFQPLQQYLVAFPGGRYQALNIVWDSRPTAAGGQRWVHLYPEQDAGEAGPVRHDDLVHWTGSFQNWNGRCAACHSTGLEKNYAADSDRFQTTWQEINVACEACHGPAARHVAWAENGAENGADGGDRGFAFSLADRGAFAPAEDASPHTLARADQRRPLTQVETCAACHSRRTELAPTEPGGRFDDQYRLAPIQPGLYFPDGQILDEVYVYGSFLQSRMHAAGVVCTDCHEPHSGSVRAADNSLCTRCHQAETFDRPTHHRHAAGSPGAACVECHMPDRTYMVVDDRRDHGFRVPEPRLTLELGVPNACNDCHADRDPQWAQDALTEWGMGGTPRATHAAVLNAAWMEQPAALPELLALASDEARPGMLRAGAALASAAFPTRETVTAAAGWLYDDDRLLRAAAVQSLDWLPAQQRWTLLRGLVGDDSKAVRMAVARQTADVPLDGLPPAEGQALAALHREYLESLRRNSDLPDELINQGIFLAASGDPVGAEQAYRRALKQAPAFTPALLNLADLYRASGLDDKARPLLEQAAVQAPGDPAPQHALGLLLIRQGALGEALPHLQQAATLAPQSLRYRYVYGVALWETGRRQDAVAELEALLAAHPGNPQLVSALASYYRELGDEEKLGRLVD